MAGPQDNPNTLAALLLHPAKSAKAEEPRRESAPMQMGLLFSASSSSVRTEPEPRHAKRTRPQSEGLVSAEVESAPRSAPVLSKELARRVWSVGALVSDVRQSLEGEYEDVWVEGEISNCRPAPSGHLYFTLKDGDSQLSVVMFRRQAQLLRFQPHDGLAVLARGRISLFEQRGQLQLIAETLEARGAGALQFAFEQLKARLLAEGLFEAEHKRPLPAFPQRIGVVTSPAGAVVHDIIRVIRRRHACLDLLIYPAVVQGPECAGSVAAGIRWFNRMQHEREGYKVDLILVARGGGSLEDLAGFNEESLARAIAGSELPVVSAIGHETDFTIADFVADLRAPTPSAAAELITAAQHRIEERVVSLEERARRAMRYQLVLARQRFMGLSAPQVLARVRDGINRRGQRLDDLRRRLDGELLDRVAVAKDRIAALNTRMHRQSPAIHLVSARRRLESAERALHQLARTKIGEQQGRLRNATARLEALSPLAVLGRGYALVYASDGTLLRDAATTRPGERIRARLARGSVTGEVVRVDPE